MSGMSSMGGKVRAAFDFLSAPATPAAPSPEASVPEAAPLPVEAIGGETAAGETGGEFHARAGAPLPAGTPPADEDLVVAALRTVHDPEIPVNIYELGLIYKLDLAEGGDVNVEMSLTAPGCPVAGEMPQQVADAVAGVAGVGRVEVTLVWDPPWTQDRMSEDAKLALGMF